MIGGGKIRLNRWQQAAVAVGSAVGALLDPRRADLIAALGETTGKPAFERVVERLKKSPEGRVSLLFFPPTFHFYSPSVSLVVVVIITELNY
jgi:ubiquinone biosynthesis protein COQ4